MKCDVLVERLTFSTVDTMAGADTAVGIPRMFQSVAATVMYLFNDIEHHSLYETLLKDDRQRFLQQVSKKQFRTVYHNANTCA